MNLGYRKSVADAPPAGPDQPISSYTGIKIEARPRTIPSPQGTRLGEGKKTVDQSPDIGSHNHTGSTFFGKFDFRKRLIIDGANFGAVLVSLSLGWAPAAIANPQGMTVVKGTATAQVNGSQLNVTVGNAAFLDWRSFNISAGETTSFLQPSQGSVVFNRIGDVNPSQIWGHLNANGSVILANANGFYFGPNSMIQVGGNFIATTAPIAPDLGAGSSWQFTGPPPLASIVNYGKMEIGQGHSLFLIAERVENHGDLKAPGGNVGLEAGKEVLLSERPDGRGLSATVKLPAGSVDNSGQIWADAGTIALEARVVNQDGILKADSVRERNGVIELIGADSVALGAQSVTEARGDSAGTDPSSGGTITIRAGDQYTDSATARLDVRGGAAGGDGGQIEISAAKIQTIRAVLDGSARPGSKGGSLLIDPQDIMIVTGGGDTLSSGVVNAGDGSGSSFQFDPGAFQGFAAITLQASRDINIAQNTQWDLSASTGVASGAHLLTLQAGRDIVFQDGSSIIDENQWSVKLQAGVDFATGQTVPGVGSIYLNGGIGKSIGGLIQTARGSITLQAGQSILVGSGAVRTAGGGSIVAQALTGDINAGTKNGGYEFISTGYRVSADLGGISTSAGGDVTLEAGHDVISVPTVPSSQYPGASGAYGAPPGNVTVSAGNNIIGNYNISNGVGTLMAGVQVQDGKVTQVTNPNADIGEPTRLVSLGLVSGKWNLWAANDININEIRNPSGVFSRNRTTVPIGAFPGNASDTGTVARPSKIAFLFDYAPDAGASLWAGDSINLIGAPAGLARVPLQNTKMPAIYPPQLSLNAGAGGINVQNTLILYPSTQGSLSMVTRDGGNLQGQPVQGGLVGIVMSDSGLPDYATFQSGHAVAPLHAKDSSLVQVDISGGVANFSLTVPMAANINIAKDAYNFGFQGQNNSAGAVTTITAGGDIRYRGDLTSTGLLADPLPAGMLDPLLNATPQAALKLRYDPVSRTLTFVGVMTDSDLQALLNPKVYVFDQYGQQVLDNAGNPVTKSLTLTDNQQAALIQLQKDSQSASLGDHGLALAGPGRFVVNARNIDLGISVGILVQAPDLPLAAISPRGADLEVNLTGNLDMTSTKIANESYLGGIAINAAGKLNIGGQFTTFGDANSPKGIFTLSGGSVSVVAQGDVNVDGSRIAAFNGGNVTVVSQHGDVNAGEGGVGFVNVNSVEPDPVTGSLIDSSTGGIRTVVDSVSGSGILATTIRGSSATVGNITVNAPEGNINADVGGIVQIAYNANARPDAFIDLEAGKNIEAGNSGVLGGNLHLKAGGNIDGLVVGLAGVTLVGQNANVIAVSGGNVSITASGTIAGTIVGGGINVSGESITAALVSKSVTTSGDASSASVGVPKSNVAAIDTKTSDDASTRNTKTSDQAFNDNDELKRKLAGAPKVRTVGRVTVILPAGAK